MRHCPGYKTVEQEESFEFWEDAKVYLMNILDLQDGL